jgi:predicted TIM-barrel fold metal-dependent hydrolase
MTSPNGYQLISADAHVLEPGDLFATRVPAKLRDRAPRLESWEGGSAWMIDGSEPVPLPASAASGSGYRLPADAATRPIAFAEVLPALYDPAERLKAQDADSVDAEILYPSPGLWDAIKFSDDAELQLACARAYNDWIAEFSAHRPDRLIGLGRLPSTGVEDARQELLRCVEQLGLRGAVLDGWPSGSSTAANPDDEPFWETANGLGVPISVHYAFGPVAETAAPAGIAPGLRPPMADIALPMASGRLFDRYPDLRLVFAHGDAGWCLHWLEFHDINYVRHKHLNEYALEDPEAVPSDYIRRHFWFTFSQDRTAVKNRRLIGPAHLMWASHFPLDTADWPDDRQQAMRITEEVPDDVRQALLADNAARLYELPGHEAGFPEIELSSFEPLVYF